MAATNSYSKQQSSNTATNQQVGAGTGGAAIGANSSGNTINVTNSDVQTVANALHTVDISTAASLATSQAALAANTQVTDSAIGGIVAVTGQAGALLQSTFTQFTGALADANNSALVAQNNASNAALNVIANAAPQTNASLQEHLAGSSVIPAGDSLAGTSSVSVTEIVVIGLALAALYVIFAKS
jgi:hypothetical protein